MKWTKKQHLIYWLMPSMVAALLGFMYFSQVTSLQKLVAPAANREFGLLENIQLLLIAATVVMSFTAFKRGQNKFDKTIFLLLGIGLLVLFLEEIDYGLHYIEMIQGRQSNTEIRNIHNQGSLLSYIKKFSYVGVAIFFGVLPLLASKVKNERIRKWVPSRRMIFTLLCLIFWSQLIQFFYKSGIETNESLTRNISEFDELMIYFMVFAYVWEKRKTIAKKLPYL